MVGIERVSNSPHVSRPGLVELASVANQQKLLPEEYLDPDRAHVSPAFIEYALPLIGGEAPTFPRLHGFSVG
ncbi:MAG: hypothetical protein WKH64_12735 [Chloroflexia bacterium]